MTLSHRLGAALLLALLCASCCVLAAAAKAASAPSHLTHADAQRVGSRVQLVRTASHDGQPLLTKRRLKVPAGWMLDAATPVPSTATVEVRVALYFSNAAELEERFWRVSDPQHAEYAQYMSREELKELVQPPRSNVDAVMAWLHPHGIRMRESISSTAGAYAAALSFLGDEVVFTVPVAVAESLLRTRYAYFRHLATGHRLLRCAEEYSIPAALEDVVAFVAPTLHMGSVESMRTQDGGVASTATALRGYDDSSMRLALAEQQVRDASFPHSDPACSPYVDLVCLRWMYSLGSVQGVSPNSSICATGFHEEYIASEDIHDFLAWFDPAWLSSDVQVIGPNDQTNPGGEATMDVQLIMGIASNVDAVFWSTTGSEPHGPDADEPFVTFLSNLLSVEDPPLVVSTSYGDDELDLDIDYVNKANSLFQAAGLRGVSILFASGDGGVAGGHGIAGCTNFVAVFPSASPFVTAVGGTYLNATIFDESGIDFSSGGFSNLWPAPQYQKEAVAWYLTQSQTTLPDGKLYNVSGRAFPDVSAMSNNVPTVIRGAAWPAGGTSCASPIFSGVIALLNDARLAQGKPPLGFLNPWLYQSAAAAGGFNAFLNDVVTGNNPGCDTAGFFAAPGWDAVTGLGTPNYQRMLPAAMKV